MSGLGNHTPGPWEAVPSASHRDRWVIYGTHWEGTPGYRSAPRIAEIGSSLKSDNEAEGLANANLIAAAPEYDEVAEAMLLFFSGSPWTPEKSARWQELTGSTEATTKSLCDFARRIRAKARGESS